MDDGAKLLNFQESSKSSRVARAFATPQKTAMEVVARTAPHLFWSMWRKRALSQGWNKLYFSISFDCDTTEDAAVVCEVDEKLRRCGVSPAYAVPGEILRKNTSEYGVIRERNADFLNHGYKIHTAFDARARRYESVFFYDEISQATALQDIRLGHEAVTAFLGRTPKGFRVPHFGTFQRRFQLQFLHFELARLGYSYSSSTLPAFAALYGSSFDHFGLLEFPVTGTYSKPHRVFDSWSFFYSPGRAWKPGDYLKEMRRIVENAVNQKWVGLLNFYADPSQVYDQSEFYEAMELLSESVPNISLDQVRNCLV